MPRNVAEYIQASSRVARNKLGLVVTLHNPFRARDLSHFERFREFHEKLYYYVEPISITPFSKKSVNKYLPLYIATIIRHNYDQLTNVENAANLTLELQNKIKKDMELLFGLLPFCVLTGKVNILRVVLESEGNLSNTVKAEAERYIEEE